MSAFTVLNFLASFASMWCLGSLCLALFYFPHLNDVVAGEPIPALHACSKFGQAYEASPTSSLCAQPEPIQGRLRSCA